jgi:hypothetical protein
LFLKFCGSRFMDSIRIRIHKVHCQLNFWGQIFFQVFKIKIEIRSNFWL